MFDWKANNNKETWIALAVAAGVGFWLIHGEMNAAPTGYVGRDGGYDVWCGHHPDGTGSSNYECTREPAQHAPALNRALSRDQ